MLERVRLWLRSVLLRRRLEREMREEMAAHLERATERLVARGLSPDSARRQAVREFGNVVWLQEEARAARGTEWLDALLADLRFAVRQFKRRPWMTLTMLVVLATGMCITTLLFSYVHAYATLPPAGLAHADDVVRIRGSQTAGAYGRRFRTFAEDELRAYRTADGPFTAVTGWTEARVTLDVGGEGDELPAQAVFVTPDYFTVLGVPPALGSLLSARDTDDGSRAMTAILSHALWRARFGGRRDVIGATLRVNGTPFTVTGVAPARFGGVTGGGERFHVWLPLETRRLLLPGVPAEFRAAARLRPGTDLRTATATARVIAARAAGTDPELRALDPSTEVVPLLSASGDPMFERDVRLLVLWIGLLALLVLLVACTNVSGLLMGLATARRHEIAVRLSLGAARTRIMRQLLTESALLAVLSAAAALALVWLVTSLATRLIPGLPFDLAVRWPAALFAFGTAFGVGIAFGLSPALHATRLGLADAMRDSAGTIAAVRGRLQRTLVVAQIAFTQPLVVLLAAVLVLVVSEFETVNRTAIGDRVAALTLSSAAATSGTTAAAAEAGRQARSALARVHVRLREAPGIEAVAQRWTATSPLGSWTPHPDDAVAGTTGGAVRLEATAADVGHFALLDIPVVRGREFLATDTSRDDSPGAETPVIVDMHLARHLWHGADAVGRRLRVASDTASGPRTLVVVGVVDDPAAQARRPRAAWRVYLPPRPTQPASTLLVRTTGPARAQAASIRQLATETAPGVVASLRTLAEIEAEQRRAFRLITGGLTGAAAVALLLCALGLYAAIAFSVAQRSREIAVRMAFGARGSRIARRFVSDGLRLGVFGLLFGLPASLAGLYVLGARVTDFPQVPLPPVTAMAGLGIVLVAMAAAWIPARRAAAVDPAVTLRRG